MSEFITTNQAVQIVFQELVSILKPKFMISKPTTPNPPIVNEYIVVNALPINSEVLQKCYVNINCYAKDISAGVPDFVKISTLETQVLNLMKKVTQSNYMIDFEGQETITEPTLNQTFSNLRFSFKLINQ